MLDNIKEATPLFNMGKIQKIMTNKGKALINLVESWTDRTMEKDATYKAIENIIETVETGARAEDPHMISLLLKPTLETLE